MAIVGVVYGALVGLFGHWLLFHQIAKNKRSGKDPFKGIGGVFFFRYMIDGASLLIFALVTRNGIGITAAAISITIAVKVSLIIVYLRKGGRID
jgi:hypothetical protein